MRTKSQVTISIDKETLEAIQRQADLEKRSLSNMVNIALVFFIETELQNQAKK